MNDKRAGKKGDDRTNHRYGAFLIFPVVKRGVAGALGGGV